MSTIPKRIQTSMAKSATPALIIIAVLLLAAYLGMQASRQWLLIIALGFGFIIALHKPNITISLVIILALMIPITFNTGSAIPINMVIFMLIFAVGVWLMNIFKNKQDNIVFVNVMYPMIFFLLLGIVASVIGNATWDVFVPQPDELILIQIGQLGIYFLSFVAFFLAANFIRDQNSLQIMTWTFLLVGGLMTVIFLLPQIQIVRSLFTTAITRPPFWLVLGSLALGQLLFNKELAGLPRIYLFIVIIVVIVTSLFLRRGSTSTWVSVGVAITILFWFKFRRLRWLAFAVFVILLISGTFFAYAFEFAGGIEDWNRTGEGRILLITRVLEDTMRNPITGLGPSAYRFYAATRALGIYDNPTRVSSHNNYVDIYSFFGIVGLLWFVWLVYEFVKMFIDIGKRAMTGFQEGFYYSMIAIGVGSLVLMMLADWILPNLYNIGIRGFQASVLIWIFLGGIVNLARAK